MKDFQPNKSVINFLAQRNGPEQDICVLEEMSELQKELMKHRRGKENRDNIINECVDVLLSVTVLLEVYNSSKEEIEKIVEYKLNRLRDFVPKTSSSCEAMCIDD